MRDFSSDEQQPLFHLGDRPVHAALLVVLVYVASMLVTTILQFAHATGLGAWLYFSSSAVLHGEVWRVLTYGLWNPPSLLFVVDMYLIVVFGREVEKFFGRRLFLTLFAGLYLLPPLLFTALGVWFPMTFGGEAGSLAIFIAFATLYPDAGMMFNLLAKWVAVILVGIYSLIDLSNRDISGLITLWATTGFAFAFVRYQQGRLTLPCFKSRRAAAPSLQRTAAPVRPAVDNLDAILDKIARSGIASLTAGERARLEAGRAALLRRRDPNR